MEKRTRIRFPGKRRVIRSVQLPRPKDVQFPSLRMAAKPHSIRTGSRLQRVGLTPADYYLEVAPPDTPTTSTLERLVFGWLVRNNIPFDYQVSVLGGRQVPGGAVLDFVVYLRFPPTVLRIMGRWWHSRPESEYADLIQKMALEDMGYTVIDLWEETLTDIRNFEEGIAQAVYNASTIFHD